MAVPLQLLSCPCIAVDNRHAAKALSCRAATCMWSPRRLCGCPISKSHGSQHRFFVPSCRTPRQPSLPFCCQRPCSCTPILWAVIATQHVCLKCVRSSRDRFMPPPPTSSRICVSCPHSLLRLTCVLPSYCRTSSSLQCVPSAGVLVPPTVVAHSLLLWRKCTPCVSLPCTHPHDLCRWRRWTR